MDVNADDAVKGKNKVRFKFTSSNDLGVLLNVHHTVQNQADGTILRVRFTVAGFTANNERMIVVDHRGNVFVFDLVSKRYWTLSEQLKQITVIEGLSGGNAVALGNKEGTVFIVDLDTKRCVLKLNAHPDRITHLVRSPEAGAANVDPAKPTEETYRRYLLVASQDSAKLYLTDGFVEVSCIRYGLASNNSFRPTDWHWFQQGVHGSSLISHSTSGFIRVYRINFKLCKELNAARLIELYLKHTPAQTIAFDQHPPSNAGSTEASEFEPTIRRLMQDAVPGLRVTMARPTADGRYYALLCCPATVAFLALDSWLICRVVTFSNLFITQFAFVPAVHVARSISETAARCRWPSTTTTTTMGSLVVRTTDNDLMLLNFGQSLRNPPFARSLAVRSEGKCYKFGLAANGRMLANVLQTGEVLLHNLDAYGDTSSSRAVSSLPVTQKARTKGVPVSGLGANYSGKCERASSSSGSCSTATACGTTSGTIAVLRPYDGTREIKLKLQLNALQTKLSKTLPKERLLPILKEYGEYPAKHRATIWRTVQELPGDADTFSGLLRRGYHPCVGDYEHRFASYDQRVVRCLKKTVSCLAHWCPVFGLIDYMPSFVLPFARQQPNDALGLFETVATVLLNQCQLWFEFAPLDPFNYLAMVENVLLECEPRLVAFYRKRNIPSRAYTMPLMETAFAGCVTTAQWLALWDHVLSNEPYFLVFLIAAYSSLHRGALLANGTATKDTFSLHQSGSVDVRRLVRRAYALMERCPDTVHPRNYFKSFRPLGMTTEGPTHHREAYRRARQPCNVPAVNGRPSVGAKVFHNDANNAIDFTSSSDGSVRQSPDERFPSPASSLAWNDVPTQATTRAYASFCNFPKKLTEIRCTKADAMQAEQRQLEAKIIELEKLEHALQERMVNNLIRQEHEQRVMAVERNLEEAIAKEEQRIEMQRKLLLLHRKQLRERESELSLDVHNAKLINEATVRERELDALLKKFERERHREETDLLFAEEDIKLKELELLSTRYQSGPVPAPVPKVPVSDERPLDQRYHVALEQLAVQKQKLYDEIDRTYSSIGMPSGVNDYTYRVVSDLRKVASVASSERYPTLNRTDRCTQARPSKTLLQDSKYTSQTELYEDTIRRMEEQVKVLQRLKNDATKKSTRLSD